MKKVKWLDRDLIISPYCIGLCTSEASYKKELKRLGVNYDGEWIREGKDGNVTEMTCRSTGTSLVIVSVRVDKKTKPLEVYGLLVHEAVHVWQKICDNISEDEPSREFEAYSIQHIAQCLIAAYGVK